MPASPLWVVLGRPGLKQAPFVGWQELKESLAHAISSHCSSSGHLRQLHARVILFGLGHNLHLCALLVGGYFSFRDVEAARQVFDASSPRQTKTLLWNTLMRGFLRNGRPELALGAFREMTEGSPACVPDRITFNLAVKACVDTSDFEFGYQLAEAVRSRGLESDLLVATALVGLYCSAGDVGVARDLFDRMTVRDAVSWNAMISGYSREGSLPDAIGLFKAMKVGNGVVPSQATMVTLLSVCGKAGSLKHGQAFHTHVIRSGFEADQFISNALMEMYIDCDLLDSSSMLFDGLMLKDSISWSIMVGGYVRHKCPHDTIKLFRRMVSTTKLPPTRPILLNVLLACADLGDWQQGKQIEEEFLRGDVNQLELDAPLSTALIYMYVKCGRIDISFKLLNGSVVVRKDVVAWNALLKGCAELGDVHMVVEYTAEMQRRGIAPDKVTLLTLITIFASTPLLRMGMTVHACVIRGGFLKESSISNSLVDMYSRCGNINDSHEVFNGIIDKDVVTWSSMLKAYAWNGCVDEALSLFQVMRETTTKPNPITFVSILSACSHGGYVDKGRALFKCMKEDYDLEPGLEHYGCMVDLFSRAGLLSEAFDFIEKSSTDVSGACVLWGALLNACAADDNWWIGEQVAKHLFHLEPRNVANYMILANIYTSSGQREDANRTLRLMRANGLEKDPGFSWSEGS